MSFIEDNPAFQAWAGEPRTIEGSSTRAYGPVDGPKVYVDDSDDRLSVGVWPDPNTDESPNDWFNQFFDQSPGSAGDDVTWEAGW